MIYIVSVEMAKEKSWKIGIPEGSEENDKFVEVRTPFDCINAYVALPDLPTDFNNIPINGYDKW